MYSWLLVVSAWIVALALTNPQLCVQLDVIHVEDAPDHCSIVPLFGMIWFWGFMLMHHSRGGRVTSWCLTHLMLTLAVTLELTSRVVFHNLIKFLMKALSVLLILYSSKHYSVHVCGIDLSAFL